MLSFRYISSAFFRLQSLDITWIFSAEEFITNLGLVLLSLRLPKRIIFNGCDVIPIIFKNESINISSIDAWLSGKSYLYTFFFCGKLIFSSIMKRTGSHINNPLFQHGHFKLLFKNTFQNDEYVLIYLCLSYLYIF